MKRLLPFLFIIFLFTISGCAGKSKSSKINNDFIKATEPLKTDLNVRNDFEKNMPKSSITLGSVVSFNKAYQRVYSDSNVVGVAAGKKMLAIINKDEIGFSLTSCFALSLSKSYDYVKVYDYNAIAISKSEYEVFSAFDCVSYNSIKRELKGGIELVGDYVIEYEGQIAQLKNYKTKKLLYNHDTGYNVIAAGAVNGKPAILQANGYLLLFDFDLKAFTLISQLPTGFNEIYHYEGIFYGTLDHDNKFFVMDTQGYTISTETNCKASLFSASGLCGTTLITNNTKYHDIHGTDFFAAGMTNFLDFKESGELNIYYLDIMWEKFMSIKSKPEVCSYNKKLYYKSYSGNFRLTKGVESTIKSIPKGCSDEFVKLKHGKFICRGKFCGKYADIVNQNATHYMLRREENNSYYYYFEAK